MSTLTKHQKINRTKYYTENGSRYRATVEIRHDDECGNGHNTFSITCDVYRYGKNGHLYEDSFGCQHDLVVRLWPDLAPFIKWHLVSTDGPMHYLANTLYHAGDKDHNGRRKGDPTGFSKGKEPDLDAARNSAVWPDATLEQLRDKSALEARLPALLAEFRRDVESLGLVY